jgi:hypothetical protein
MTGELCQASYDRILDYRNEVLTFMWVIIDKNLFHPAHIAIQNIYVQNF